MANVHILDVQRGVYARIVYHIPTPAGNNNSGVAWKDVVVRAGLNTLSVLKDGDGVGGTISAAEKASIAAGDLVEMVFVEKAQPLGAVNLTRLFNLHQAEFIAMLNNTYNKFGGTN